MEYVNFVKFLDSIYPLDEITCNKLLPYFKRIDCREGFLLLKAGQTPHSIFFIEKGLTRTFSTDEQGNEKTTSFTGEFDIITSLTQIYESAISEESIEVLEDTIIWAISYEDIIMLNKTDITIANLSIRVLERIVKTYEFRINLLKSYTTEQHYLTFIRHYPNIYNRVKLNHLASFLGTTPTHLSRIRKQIAEKKA